MGSSCSRDSSGAVNTDSTVPPIASTSRSTEGIRGRNQSEQNTSLPSGLGGLGDLGDSRPGRSLLSRLRRTHSSELSRQQERELREIEQLQFELAAMEALFQSMLGQAFREMTSVAQQESSGGPPPASAQAVRQLPCVCVSPEDLVEETNRECAVCFVDNHIGDRVVRLPCGHLFHRDCISQWLFKHCTCPVCRYELPTEDPHYERGRVERMQMRRPRMRRYELERMHARELQELAFTRLNLSDRHDVLTDKADLIDRIVRSGKVDIVASPDPVEYKMSDLRAMGVATLRHTMSDAGVIFDPVEVVEKEDMVQMFVHSGRLMLIPEENGTRSSGTSLKSDDGDVNRKRNAREIEDNSEADSHGGSHRMLKIDPDSSDSTRNNGAHAGDTSEMDLEGRNCEGRSDAVEGAFVVTESSSTFAVASSDASAVNEANTNGDGCTSNVGDGLEEQLSTSDRVSTAAEDNSTSHARGGNAALVGP